MRTVGVKLLAELSAYVQGMRKGAAATSDLTDELNDAARAGKATARATDEVGDKARRAADGVEKMAHEAAKLDAQILVTRAALSGLARDFAQAGDDAARLDITKNMAKQQGELRKLLSVRSLLDDDRDGGEAHQVGVKIGTRMAGGVADGLASVGTLGGRAFASVPPQVQAAIGGAILAAAAAVAPGLGALVAGAVVGGVGVGGVVGGLALAARDPRVQGVASATGQELSQMLGRSSAAFVPVTLDALGQLRTGIRGMEGEFKDAFDSASKFVEPLTKGAVGFVSELMPGIQSALDQAGPVIDELAGWGPKLGRLLGDSLSLLAEHADEGAAALHTLWLTFDAGVSGVIGIVDALATMYGWMQSAKDALGPLGISLSEIYDKVGSSGLTTQWTHFPPAIDAVGASMQATADKTRYGSEMNELYRETMSRMAQESLGAFDTETRLGAAIDRAAEAARKGKDTTDAHTEAGRKNRDALSGLAAATLAAASAAGTQTGKASEAQAVMDRGYTAFVKAAVGMGKSKQEADALARSLGLIPSPKVSVTANTGPAKTAVVNLVNYIDHVNGKTATMYVKVVTVGNVDRVTSSTGGGRSIQRWGGIDYAMARGGAIEAHYAASPTVLYGERETGGEAFIPRNGDRDRSLKILEKAAGWYGKTLATQGRYMTLPSAGALPSAGPAPVTNHFVINGGDQSPQQIAERVSEILGRQSDLYMRS